LTLASSDYDRRDVPAARFLHASGFLDIAFGMGTTYHSAINLGMRTDAVDLSPSVPRQMSTFYPDAGKYLHNPLGRVITADGRNYVRLTSRQYDIISGDPPPPLHGAVVLYTREFYADARRCLRANGLMLQWLSFGVNLDLLREHLRTFRSVFPHVLVVISPMHGGLYMLGSDGTSTGTPTPRHRSWDHRKPSRTSGARRLPVHCRTVLAGRSR
jgi:spermidine synthase